jgi:hypothetical protein
MLRRQGLLSRVDDARLALVSKPLPLQLLPPTNARNTQVVRTVSEIRGVETTQKETGNSHSLAGLLFQLLLTHRRSLL